jgi:hypothetical protein
MGLQAQVLNLPQPLKESVQSAERTWRKFDLAMVHLPALFWQGLPY